MFELAGSATSDISSSRPRRAVSAVPGMSICVQLAPWSTLKPMYDTVAPFTTSTYTRASAATKIRVFVDACIAAFSVASLFETCVQLAPVLPVR